MATLQLLYGNVLMARKRKDTKVIYRHLGKERAWGLAHIGDNKIEIDSRLTGRRHLYLLFHEWTHIQHPDWSETRVIKYSKELTRFVWTNQIRWVDLK